MGQSNKYLTVKDFLVSGKSFDLVYDEPLDLLKTTPQPPAAELPLYYESEDYISHTDKKGDLISRLYQWVKKRSLSKKTQLLFRQNSGLGSVLDVGAGTGDFLKAAREKGWEVQGVEPNKKARDLAAKKGVSLMSSLRGFKGQKLDVVTLWHVLEHIPNLEETVEQLSELVKTNGCLIIAVPNFKSYDAKYYGPYWAAYDVPRHLWHFSKRSIETVFSDHFDLEKTVPMMFDSFYVSLLSEKYKSGKKISLKAFWIGLWSNIKGAHTKEYSSHIYCFRKIKTDF